MVAVSFALHSSTVVHVFSVTIVLGQTAPVHFHHINNSLQLLKNKGGILDIWEVAVFREGVSEEEKGLNGVMTGGGRWTVAVIRGRKKGVAWVKLKLSQQTWSVGFLMVSSPAE